MLKKVNLQRGINSQYARILGALFCFGITSLSAQEMGTKEYVDPLGIDRQLNQNQILNGAVPSVQDNNAQATSDTTKKPPKIRKPLESYFFLDSVRSQPNFNWTLVPGENKINLHRFDTLLDAFHNDVPFLRQGVGAAYMGNNGDAALPLNYFDRPQYRNFSFAQVMDPYLMRVDRARFFNVKKPLTQVSYFMSGQTRRFEETFWGTHAQNISPSTGFNIDYKTIGSRGMYVNHKARDKNLSMAFNHTGKKYTVHAGYIYNMATIKENGGIVDDREIRDTVLEMPELVRVHLKDAKNRLKGNTYYLTQSYGIPLRKLTDDDFSIADQSSLFIGHSFEYSTFSRLYTDTHKESSDTLYYDHWFINPVQSHDSISENLLSNQLFVQIQPWNRNGAVGLINAGVGNDMHHYYQFQLPSLVTGSGGVKQNSSYFYGSIEGHAARYFTWSAHAKYTPFGYRSQDLTLGGGMELNLFFKEDRPVTLSGNLWHDQRTPDYWMQNFFSNHFVWSNSFQKENETRITARLKAPSIGAELGVMNSITENKIYINALKAPAQDGGAVNVLGLYAQKDFRFGGFHLNNRVLLQSSSKQDVIPVPAFSAYFNYYYQFHIVRGVLQLQLGVDGRYNTTYYGFGYNPATMQFYNQREMVTHNGVQKSVEMKGYPMLDFFVSAKWKRMRILAKIQHLNYDMFGERNYFSVAHMPLNKRMFKLGFSWNFYD